MGELRHQVRGAMELLNERSISLEDKVLYFLLCALVSRFMWSRLTMMTVTGQRYGTILVASYRLISELHDQEKVLQLEIAVGEKEHELNMLRALMREELKKKDEQIANVCRPLPMPCGKLWYTVYTGHFSNRLELQKRARRLNALETVCFD